MAADLVPPTGGSVSLSPSFPRLLPLGAPIDRVGGSRRCGHRYPIPETDHDHDDQDPAEARTLPTVPDGDRELRRPNRRTVGRPAGRHGRVPDLPHGRQPGVSALGVASIVTPPTPTFRGYRRVSPLRDDHRRGPRRVPDRRLDPVRGGRDSGPSPFLAGAVQRCMPTRTKPPLATAVGLSFLWIAGGVYVTRTTRRVP